MGDRGPVLWTAPPTRSAASPARHEWSLGVPALEGRPRRERVSPWRTTRAPRAAGAPAAIALASSAPPEACVPPPPCGSVPAWPAPPQPAAPVRVRGHGAPAPACRGGADRVGKRRHTAAAAVPQRPHGPLCLLHFLLLLPGLGLGALAGEALLRGEVLHFVQPSLQLIHKHLRLHPAQNRATAPVGGRHRDTDLRWRAGAYPIDVGFAELKLGALQAREQDQCFVLGHDRRLERWKYLVRAEAPAAGRRRCEGAAAGVSATPPFPPLTSFPSMRRPVRPTSTCASCHSSARSDWMRARHALKRETTRSRRLTRHRIVSRRCSMRCRVGSAPACRRRRRHRVGNASRRSTQASQWDGGTTYRGFVAPQPLGRLLH